MKEKMNIQERMRELNPERRTCNRKSYITRAGAKKMMVEWNKTHENKLNNIYKCDCGFFHLTSMDKEDSRNLNGQRIDKLNR